MSEHLMNEQQQRPQTVEECDALNYHAPDKWEAFSDATIEAMDARGEEEDDMVCVVCGFAIEEHPSYQSIEAVCSEPT